MQGKQSVDDREQASEQGETPPGWPKNVAPILFDSVGRLGVDEKNQLYWDGRRIEIERRLTLTWWQVTIAAVAAAGSLASGVAAVATWLRWFPVP